jgi:hypothetical protein
MFDFFKKCLACILGYTYNSEEHVTDKLLEDYRSICVNFEEIDSESEPVSEQKSDSEQKIESDSEPDSDSDCIQFIDSINYLN